jgi:hypothetical protein
LPRRPAEGSRADVDAIAAAGGPIENELDLCRNHHIVAEWCHRLPEHAFSMATTIGVGCVEEPHATFVGGANSGNRHLIVDLTPTGGCARKLPGATQRPRTGAESGQLPLADSPNGLCGRCWIAHCHSFEVDREPVKSSTSWRKRAV